MTGEGYARVTRICDGWGPMPVPDADAKLMEDGSSTRGVLMHLCWHWVYHSGHIGLLSFEAGYDYEWTVRKPLARP